MVCLDGCVSVLLISLLTFDEMSVSVGDDSCNKNEMNTVNAWLAAFEKQVNDLIFSGGYYEISEWMKKASWNS